MGRFDSLIGQMGSDNPLRSVADYEGDMLKREQLRMAMGANALTMDERKQKLAEYQRGLGEQAAVRNILAGLGPDAKPEAQIGALRSSGLPTGLKLADELEKNYDTRRKTDAEVAGKNWIIGKDKNQIKAAVMSRVAQDPTQWESVLTMLEQNGLVDFNWSSKARQRATQASPEAIRQWALQEMAGGIDPKELMPKSFTTDTGGYVTRGTEDPLSGKQNPGWRTYEKTATPGDLQRAADAAANRDVTIRGQDMSDARARELAAERAAEKKAAANDKSKVAQDDAASVIASLRAQYDVLDKNKAITSTERDTLSNVGAAIGSSAVGQTFGRAVGSESQSARNQIVMARPALVSAIVRATGMSAKSIDSNAELKLMLMTATDPTLDLQANKAALDRLEQSLVSGRFKEDGQKGEAPQPAPAKPQSGSYSDAEKERRYQEWKARQK